MRYLRLYNRAEVIYRDDPDRIIRRPEWSLASVAPATLSLVDLRNKIDDDVGNEEKSIFRDVMEMIESKWSGAFDKIN